MKADQTSPRHPSHNYGIDLLRLLAFVYVIVLHTIGHGGIIQNSPAGSHQYMLAAGMEIWACCAVNLFGLISGYVGFRDKKEEKAWKARALSYLELWLQVVFYAVVPSLIQFFLMPGSLEAGSILRGFFPVTTGAYWYFSAYTGLFLLMPVLNAALRSLDVRYLKRFLVIFLVVFSLYASPMERFALREGYSTFWLVLLYLAGGAVRKIQDDARSGGILSPVGAAGGRIKRIWPVCLAGITVCALFAWTWLLRGWHLTLFDIQIKPTTWMSYTSFTTTMAALLHLIWFSRVRVPKKLRHFVRVAASCSFGVYLLNTQPALWKLTDGRFAWVGSARLVTMILVVLANILVFMTAGLIMDYARKALFDVFKPSAPSD